MKQKSSRKVKVYAAWNREAVHLLEEFGWEALFKKSKSKKNGHHYDCDILTFDTEKEAIAYIRGINDSNGWDDPYVEIV